MPKYKPRKCEVCDKEFVPERAAQIYCSDSCRRERNIILCRDYRKSIKNLVQELKEKCAAYESRIAQLEAQLEAALKVSKDKSKKPSENLNIDTSNFEYCERMRLKMEHLPCGQRDECWIKPACERTKGMDEKVCQI